MQKYTLKELVEIFKVHSLQYEKQREEYIISFKENNPNKELPENLTDTFSISEALQIICENIISIEKKMENNTHIISFEDIGLQK